jgi:Cu-Zn family superoxide dismutase
MLAAWQFGEAGMTMRNPVSITLAAVLAGAAVPAPAAQRNAIAVATLHDAEGAAKGQLRMIERGERVQLELSVTGLPPGSHGVHLHAVGNCDAPGFASAGPHLNPHARMHGTLNPRGSHLGDLPNINVGRSGKGSLAAWLPGSVDELRPDLFDANGTAVVVHAAADDFRTDPSGASGARIACGVLKPGG